ncbi:hypothetical protein KQI76_04305 [Amphibacillus sp. MSJ-3]|uniref:hypothetical protein n=1 Tax=Amphibacillus sp. MSJ-3 TaxID=2841505 RepID=UPI001C0EF797|nr:hypothetical protein [Amphibacillus sp. MSJ-3]MBU5594379.1 hypothetical protein [Amphibacillus sp. MSJ-3]
MDRSKMNHYEMDNTKLIDLFTGYFENINIPVNKVDLYRMINISGSRAFFIRADSSDLGYIGKQIAHDKLLQKDFLRKAGISVAQSQVFLDTEKERARNLAKELSSSVVKPLRGNQAKGVTIGVETDSEFDLAWDEALSATSYNKVLVEENFQNGTLARYLVIDNKCIAVVEFTKPFVIGNGKDTIEELINQKNELRKQNPSLSKGLLKINETYHKNIKDQGFTLSSIPKSGTKIILDHKANPRIGSETIDITDRVHPLFKKLAEDAANAIPGLTITGVDLLALDHTIEPQKDNYRIIEMNNRPGTGGHIYPLYGYPRDVIKAIATHILNTIKIDQQINEARNINHSAENIPTNGDLSTLQYAEKPNQYNDIMPSETELIASEFEKAGYHGSFIGKYFVTSIDGKSIAFDGSLSSNFSFFAKQLLKNQFWVRKFLKQDGLTVIDGGLFKSNAKKKATDFAEKFNMQVQLEYQNKKISVYSQSEFEKAWEELSKLYDQHQMRSGRKKRGILITRLYNNEIKSRYLIIHGECVGVIQYTPSSTGGFDTFNITPYAHPQYKYIAEKAARIFIGMDIVGVDIISSDHSKDPEEVGYAVVGLKVNPSILEFHYPNHGKSQNIAKLIVESTIKYESQKKKFKEMLDPMKEADIMIEHILNDQKSSEMIPVPTHKEEKTSIIKK